MKMNPSHPIPCWKCKHPDNRDASHARGCPNLPAVPERDVYRMQRETAAAWESDIERARRLA